MIRNQARPEAPSTRRTGRRGALAVPSSLGCSAQRVCSFVRKQRGRIFCRRPSSRSAKVSLNASILGQLQEQAKASPLRMAQKPNEKRKAKSAINCLSCPWSASNSCRANAWCLESNALTTGSSRTCHTARFCGAGAVGGSAPLDLLGETRTVQFTSGQRETARRITHSRTWCGVSREVRNRPLAPLDLLGKTRSAQSRTWCDISHEVRTH